jgi:hypothetical protein
LRWDDHDEEQRRTNVEGVSGKEFLPGGSAPQLAVAVLAPSGHFSRVALEEGTTKAEQIEEVDIRLALAGQVLLSLPGPVPRPDLGGENMARRKDRNRNNRNHGVAQLIGDFWRIVSWWRGRIPSSDVPGPQGITPIVPDPTRAGQVARA